MRQVVKQISNKREYTMAVPDMEGYITMKVTDDAMRIMKGDKS